MFYTGRNNLGFRLSLFKNTAYLFGQGISGKVPVMGFLTPQHVPYRAAHEAYFTIPRRKQRGGFLEDGMNGY
jgi:hypothetical protein